MDKLTQLQLNRTFLDRQLLLERTELKSLAVIAHLVALQSQEANSPYESLWARIEGFKPRDLDELFLDRSAVRGTWFRSTVQTTTAEDYLAFRGIHSEIFLRGMDRLLEGIDGADWVEELRKAYSGAGALHGPELVAIADGLMPGQSKELWKSHNVRRAVAMLRKPKGPNGRTLGPRDPWIEAVELLGELPIAAESVNRQELIRRYLAAYGPASVADASYFLGLSRLGPIFKNMGLREYQSEKGTVLYDLPDLELTDPSVKAPVRLMASFDHTILGHADRTRIIDQAHSPIISGVNAMFKPYILVDGRVTGYWTYGLAKDEIPEVHFHYFSRPTKLQESELISEAESWTESWFGSAESLRINMKDYS